MAKGTSKPPRDWNLPRWPFVIGVLLLLLGTGGWYLAYGRENPDLVRARELMQQLSPDAANRLPDDQRRRAFGELREVAERLPREARDQLFREGPMGQMRERMRAEISKYFETPMDQRVAYLDRHIDEMEARMARWREGGRRGEGRGERGRRGEGGPGQGPEGREGRGPGGPPGAGGGPPAGGPGGPGGEPPGGPGFGGGRPGGRDGGPPWSGGGTEDRRRQRMRDFLDDTTPEERAQTGEFFRALRERRAQRGLTSFGGPRPF